MSEALPLWWVRCNASHTALHAAGSCLSARAFVLQRSTSVACQNRVNNIEHCIRSIHVPARSRTGQDSGTSFVDGVALYRVVVACGPAAVIQVNSGLGAAVQFIIARCRGRANASLTPTPTPAPTPTMIR